MCTKQDLPFVVVAAAVVVVVIVVGIVVAVLANHPREADIPHLCVTVVHIGPRVPLKHATGLGKGLNM